MLSLAFTTTKWQAATYLLGIALFSIFFLVFLDSTVSFVITERIGQKHNVGDAVGTLGFADEVVALVACPVWGLVSDRIGVRWVAVMGYAIVGLSLWVFVQAKNVYPQLLLARLFFSVGGAAASTMVTAILPTMTYRAPPTNDPRTPSLRSPRASHQVTPSISSELTITPARYRSQSPQAGGSSSTKPTGASTSQLAGLVGMFTGFGALLALAVFLPLPARLENAGRTPSVAVRDTYYLAGAVGLIIAILVGVGLRSLPGEDGKGWKYLIVSRQAKAEQERSHGPKKPLLSYSALLLKSLGLGFRDVEIGLGYLGGFVARASSVAISLFIPLFCNAYFISLGVCDPDSKHEEMKKACHRGYVVAAILSGTSQLVALICAPVFGYLSGRYRRFNIPLLLSAVAGMVGYIAFGLLKSPDPNSEDGNAGVFFIVALLGISQIGAIVCSLGLLSRGIQGGDIEPKKEESAENGNANGNEYGIPENATATAALDAAAYLSPSNEDSPLLPSHLRTRQYNGSGNVSSRDHLKGSIAGVYSLAGGAGILILTKVGGALFDMDPGSPFWLMAGFNVLLFAVSVGCAVFEAARGPRGEDETA